MGAQIKSIVKQSFHLGSIAQAHTSDAILSGKSVLITLGKKGKDVSISHLLSADDLKIDSIRFLNNYRVSLRLLRRFERF